MVWKERILLGTNGLRKNILHLLAFFFKAEKLVPPALGLLGSDSMDSSSWKGNLR